MASNDDTTDEEASEAPSQKDEQSEGTSGEEEPEQDPFDDDALFDLVSDAEDEAEGEASDREASSADAATGASAEDASAEPSGPGLDSSSEPTAADILDEPEASPTDHTESEAASGEPRSGDFSDDSGMISGVTEVPDVTEDRTATEPDAEADEEIEAERASDDAGNEQLEREGEPLLTVDNLKTYFYTKEGEVPAVDGVDFELHRGETLGLVGESGSGKSVSALSILRLVPDPPGKIVDGEIDFEGTDLTDLTDEQMRGIRGNDISMIFQEPMTSLNPVYTVGNQIVEAITLHQDVEYAEAREMAIGMLEKVGIPAPRERIDEYPHQMSGGMKQRVMIAMALACNPKLLIADEPTTALDVTIQAQILDLLQELQDEMDMSVLFITHDLGVVAETCDYVAVMYGGRVVEYGDVETIFENPSHPYTIGLLSSLPQVDIERQRRRKDRLYVIPGMVPSPQNFPSGCRFRDRCDYATEKCADLPQNTKLEEPGHESLCWYAREVREGTKEKTGPYPDEGSENVEAAE